MQIGKIKRISFTEDLNKLNNSVREVSIHGTAKNLQRLKNLKHLDRLYVCTLNQEQFDLILSLVDPPELKMYELRASDLSALSLLTNVRKLELDWNTKATTLWEMEKNLNLRELSINDFSRLHDVSSLKDARTLESLHLSGGMWNRLNLDTLEPLAYLSTLRELGLGNLTVKDHTQLQPIGNLKDLQMLDISNQFETEEYARLSVMLPDTKCESFRPYRPSSALINVSDLNVMVVGKRKPFLNTKRDAARLQKYSDRFAELQEKFRLGQR